MGGHEVSHVWASFTWVCFYFFDGMGLSGRVLCICVCGLWFLKVLYIEEALICTPQGILWFLVCVRMGREN